MTEYRYEAAGVAGFVQQLAVSYLTNGYYFYVPGRIPERKDPYAVDRKLLDRYDIAVSKWTRARRKKDGSASVQYLRHGRFFLLLATHGEHRLFEEEASVIRDVRRQPIRFAPYSIGVYDERVSVRLSLDSFRALRGELLRLALRRDAVALERMFRELPFEPYGPVLRQLYTVLRAVNRRRRTAGLELVDWRCVRSRRRVVQALLPSALSERLDDSHAA